MLINSIAGTSGVSQNQNIKKTDAKLLQAIASLVSGQKTNDVADVALATQLQSQVAGLKQVSSSFAQATSLTQVADGALSQAQNIVGRLREIAQQSASGAVSAENRVALDSEFQALVKELDAQVANTQFNGKNLLDGTFRGDNALSLNSLLSTSGGDDSNLEIDNLSTQILFGGASLNVLSANGAQNALEALSTADGQIASVRAKVGAFQQTLNYSAASIDSAIINQEAARSLLSDADFLDTVTQSQQLQVQQNAQVSLAAQGNRLPSALLQLIS